MLNFEELRAANAARVVRWHGPDAEPWSGADWSNAMCGEAGEAANVVKKLRRHETRIPGTVRVGDGVQLYNTPRVPELLEKLGKEIADTIIYADLLAHYYGINLGDVVIAKFNEVSVLQRFPERLGPPEVPAGFEKRIRPCPHHVPCADPNGCSGYEIVPIGS